MAAAVGLGGCASPLQEANGRAANAQELSEPVEVVLNENVTLDSDGATEEISFSRRGTRNFRAPQ